MNIIIGFVAVLFSPATPRSLRLCLSHTNFNEFSESLNCPLQRHVMPFQFDHETPTEFAWPEKMQRSNNNNKIMPKYANV